MNSASPTHVILCNGSELPNDLAQLAHSEPLRLEYEDSGLGGPNTKISLQKFIRDVNHLPIRIRDLLEIAAYVFSADRLIFRGAKDLVEYHSWSRNLHFVIKVRDINFWQRQDVQNALSAALTFMSGDFSYDFTFMEGRPTTITNLFDKEEFLIEPERESKIVLFSGGVDSLAGVLDDLEKTQSCLYLVSHRSGQPSTIRTQDVLFKTLKENYGNRVRHYKFHCSFRGIRGIDENQRTRAFLYTAIAFALSQALRQTSLTVYENGVTAMNLPKREDMVNARASRTTHPRTIHLLEKLYSLISASSFSIKTPFLWKTKTDILKGMKANGRPELISSAVSCSKTFRNTETTTHCGQCSQCVDRRLSAYAAELEDFDHPGLYTFDFFTNEIEGETKTLVVDYVRQAGQFVEWSIDNFYQEKINELVDIYDYIGLNEEEGIKAVYDLHHRHGEEVREALRRIMKLNFDPFKKFPDDSFLQLISDHEHLKNPKIQEREVYLDGKTTSVTTKQLEAEVLGTRLRGLLTELKTKIANRNERKERAAKYGVEGPPLSLVNEISDLDKEILELEVEIQDIKPRLAELNNGSFR